MPFRGSLRDFSPFRLLEFMDQGKRSGALTIEYSLPLDGKRSGPLTKTSLYLREGALVHVMQEGAGASTGLIQLLKEDGRLNRAQEIEILSQARTHSEKELAILLMEAGLAKREEILAAVEARFWKSLPLLLRLQEGRFQFQANLSPPPGRITVSIPLERVLLEAKKLLQQIPQPQVTPTAEFDSPA